MNSFQDLFSSGKDMLGQASTQFAPATALAGSSLSSGLQFMKSGAKAVRSSLKDNLGSFVGKTYTFRDREGIERVVTEVSLIAEGGFGAVTLVRDGRTGAEFALKKIHCQDDVQVASTVEAAKQEAEILLKLPPHPHIVQCLGYSADNISSGCGTVRLLLELCQAGHLLDYQDKRNGNLSAKEVMVPMMQITDAVLHLHKQRPPIQHRDLKVENVLQGNDGQWKLCDFGSCSTDVVPAEEIPKRKLIALQDEIEKTVTMLYRPPEMAIVEDNARKGYVIDTQVDIWMLGCILYTLAFYRHPFQDSANAMAISNAKYFIPTDHPMARSAKLVGLIHWLLSQNPKDRPSSAKLTELLANLAKCKYEDFYASMPASVQEKMNKLKKLFSARKDTGDITADAFDSCRKAQAEPRRASEGSSEGFDLNAALAPAAPSDAPRRRASDTDMVRGRGGYGGRDQAEVVRSNTAPAEDLLSLGSPQPALVKPAGPPQVVTNGGAPAGGFEDLLGFGDFTSGSTASAPCPPANAAPGSGGAGGSLIDLFDPAPSTAATSRAGAAPQMAASAPAAQAGFGCDFADFSFAPSMPPPAAAPAAPLSCSGEARAAGQPYSQQPGAAGPAQTANLLDLL